MASQVDGAAAAIAAALAPKPTGTFARWRWGTVSAVNNDGTMDVVVGGATMPSVRCAAHTVNASVGDRVRVAYLGTDAIVDAVRATSGPLYANIVWSAATPNGDDFDCWTDGQVTCISVVDLTLTSSLSSGSNRVVGQLPTGIPYPAKHMYVQAVMAAGYANTWIKVDGDTGEIRVSNRSGASLSTSTAITFSTSYIC